MTKDTLPARIKAHNARRGQTTNEAAVPLRNSRERALELALVIAEPSCPSAEVVKTAEAFLAFLNGEAANG